MAPGRVAEHGIADMVTWAVPSALRPEQMNASPERFARDVAPRLEAASVVQHADEVIQ